MFMNQVYIPGMIPVVHTINRYLVRISFLLSVEAVYYHIVLYRHMQQAELVFCCTTYYQVFYSKNDHTEYIHTSIIAV